MKMQNQGRRNLPVANQPVIYVPSVLEASSSPNLRTIQNALSALGMSKEH